MGDRRMIWIYIAYYVVLIAAWWLTRDAPARTSGLYYLTRASQRVAHTVGAVGLWAENAYYNEVERTRV